ncbi:MAG: hypothetical protein FJ009_14280 [Chloroflexi bacterium]|nr:hypothetical protein [Chloroflexota bacterium]
MGAETVLAACIIRQAVDDLKETRAGKRFNREHPWASDPLGDLRAFFASDWFVALASGLGQEPHALLKRMQAVDL